MQGSVASKEAASEITQRYRTFDVSRGVRKGLRRLKFHVDTSKFGLN
jgi:hypothetical protein